MVLDGKSSQKHPANTGVPQGSILGRALFLLYINDLIDDVICDTAIYCYLWQQLELVSELESDLRDAVD